MPPNSVFEWVIGQNIPQSRKKQPPRRESIKIELSTDDEEDTDIVTVTYPRKARSSKTKRKGKVAKLESNPEGKRVSFEEKPLKSALKKPRESSSSEESSSASSSDESETASASDESSDDPEPPNTKKKAKPRKTKKSKPAHNKTSSNGGPEPDKTSHQNCACICCFAGRELLAKAVDAIAKSNKAEEVPTGEKDKCGQKKNGKGQKSKKAASIDTENDTDTTAVNDSSVPETSDESTAAAIDKESEPKPSKKRKQKGKDKNKEDETGNSEPEAKKDNKTKGSDGQSKDGGESSKNGVKEKEDKAESKQNGGKPKDGKGKPKDNEAERGKNGSDPKKSKDAEGRHPHMIMPPRERLLQMEHVVEDPKRDPPPNSYFDNDRGICRVYHGPYWGGPYMPLNHTAGTQYPANPPGGLPPPSTQPYPPPAFMPPYNAAHSQHEPFRPGQQMTGYTPYPSWTAFPPQYGSYQPPDSRPPPPTFSGGLAPAPAFGISGMPPDTRDGNPFADFSLSPLKGTSKAAARTDDAKGKGKDAGNDPWATIKSAKGSGRKWTSPPPSNWVKGGSSKNKSGADRDGRNKSNNGGGGDGSGWGGGGSNKDDNNPSSSSPVHFGNAKPSSDSGSKSKSKTSERDQDASGGGDGGGDGGWGGGGGGGGWDSGQQDPLRPDPTQSMPGSWQERAENNNGNNENNDNNNNNTSWGNDDNNNNNDGGGDNTWNTTNNNNYNYNNTGTEWGDATAAPPAAEW